MIDPATFAHDILTADEERRLAHQWRDAQFYSEMLRINPDLPETTRDSFERIIRRGKEARDRLIEQNQRLVFSVAARFTGRGLELEDLIQAGNMGLIYAIDNKFDPGRGNKLSTYAVHWIRQSVARAIHDQGRTVRLPVHVGDKVNRLARTAQGLAQDLGREPTPEELAKATGMKPGSVRRLLTATRQALSLETPVGEGDSSLGDFIEDGGAALPDDAAAAGELGEAIQEALASLSPREARVIELRYGLGGHKEHSLREVGEKFGVTRERIRQIEARALKKLRKYPRARKLRSHL